MSDNNTKIKINLLNTFYIQSNNSMSEKCVDKHILKQHIQKMMLIHYQQKNPALPAKKPSNLARIRYIK